MSIVTEKSIWQLFTYMFLHGSPMHLIINMYILVAFGLPIEEEWGKLKFILYYIFCGVGAGLLIFGIGFIAGGQSMFTITIGASGAIFGVFLAFAMLFPDAEILLMFILPIKAKYMIAIFAVWELYGEFKGGGNISHIGHLGGLIFGLLYFVLLEKKSAKISKTVEKVKTKIDNKKSEIIEKSDKEKSSNYKKEILRKLKESDDIDSLTDEEFQFVRYLNIMIDDNSAVSYSLDDLLNKDFLSDVLFINMVRTYMTK